MHVILATVGTSGDVFPYIGLGRVLRGRGHRVTLAAPESYRARAGGEGFGFVPLATAEEEGRTLGDADLWHPLRAGPMMARWGAALMPQQYEDLAGLTRGPDAVLVANPGLLPARLVQEKLGVPMASLLLQPGLLPSCSGPRGWSGAPPGSWSGRMCANFP
jgi:rhamnosyltransferase subunit B